MFFLDRSDVDGDEGGGVVSVIYSMFARSTVGYMFEEDRGDAEHVEHVEV